jgi:L-seryl-tRNA(Ser) seleniumtransferase
VIETSDARLVETGTTNRTRAADFAHAITPFTRVLLKVHPSNYRVIGFTESASREDLVALARDRGLVAIEDLGSGTLVDLTAYGMPAEPTVQHAVAAGVDIVTFSGDKLLGGPQAGIAVGRADLIARMKQNPLYRALRVDKATVAALEATLRVYLDPDRVAERLPVLRMLAQPREALQDRADRVSGALAQHESIESEVVSAEGFAGGGSLPEEAIADVAVTVRVAGTAADALHAALRNGDPAVVGRIADGVVWLHMRTISDDDVPRIEAAFSRLKP